MDKTKQEAKKRMMFIQKEDYNFLTYNLLLILDVLDCTKEDKAFKDFRKIAYLIDFISSDKQTENTSSELARIYSRAQLKKKLISHLLIVLKNKNYLGISLNRTHKSFDIWLKKENIPLGFFNHKEFSLEKENINKIKSNIGTLRTSAIKTLVDVLFTNKGVLTWEI